MALKDLIRPAPTPASERPPGITCEKYLRREGKRCQHYVSNGACSLPDELMCVEWLKANGHQVLHDGAAEQVAVASPSPPAEPVARDLFGNPVPVVEEPAPKPRPASPPAALPRIDGVSSSAIDVDQLRGFTTEDIASFKALGVEVCLESERFGEVWLVPEYTNQARKEITPEHAATVMRVLSVFPGSRVVAFEKPPNRERPERPEIHR